MILKDENTIYDLTSQAEQLKMLQDYIQFDFLKGRIFLLSLTI